MYGYNPNLNFKFRRKVVLYNNSPNNIINSTIKIIINKNILGSKVNSNYSDIMFTDELFNVINSKILNLNNDIIIFLRTSINSYTYKTLYMYYGGKEYDIIDDFNKYFIEFKNVIGYNNYYGYLEINNNTVNSFGFNGIKFENKVKIESGLTIISRFEPLNPSADYFIRQGIIYGDEMDTQDVKFFGSGYSKSGSTFSNTNFIDFSSSTISYTIQELNNLLQCHISFVNNLLQIRSGIQSNYNDDIVMNNSFISTDKVTSSTPVNPVLYLLNIKCYNFYVFNEYYGNKINYTILDEENVYNKSIFYINIDSSQSDNVYNFPIEIQFGNSSGILVDGTNNLIYDSGRVFFITDVTETSQRVKIELYNNDNIKNYNKDIYLFFDNTSKSKIDMFGNKLEYINSIYNLYINNLIRCLFFVLEFNEDIKYSYINYNNVLYNVDINISKGIHDLLLYNNNNKTKIFLDTTEIFEFDSEIIDKFIKIINSNILYAIGFNSITNYENIDNLINNYSKIKYIQWR